MEYPRFSGSGRDPTEWFVLVETGEFLSFERKEFGCGEKETERRLVQLG
jgi:hypothetical protein